MTDTLAPVERTNWALNYRPGILPLTGIMSLRPGCMVRTICGQPRRSPRVFTWGGFSSYLPTHTSLHWAKIDAHFRKNRLKRPKIKQGTTLKVNCILFNRLLSPVLLNKSGLVRAKAGSFNLKSTALNKCFSNYYQV